MKLFTPEIIQQLTAQYPLGGDLEQQQVVCKVFNPYGLGTWYCINMDPSDKDYIWCIACLFEVEIGSVLRSELESIKVHPDRVPPFQMPLERDLHFQPINAQDVYEKLLAGEHL